jgi:hypothetical protein
MGNNSSIIKNKNNDNSVTFKDLNNKNNEFISKLDEIATNYILGQNFQDMIKLTNSKHCDDLVIITSKILKKSYLSGQIQAIYKRISEGENLNIEDEYFESHSKNISKLDKKNMCIEIAKYYVKIAHLFAAIMTTLNPVFSWKSSASSSRATLSPYIPSSQNLKEEENILPEKVEQVALENKHYISEMAKNIKVESLNFCNSRISDLIDIDDLTDILSNENDVGNPIHVSDIKIKTKLCSSNLNNYIKNDENTGRKKTVYDLPGFAELSRLYNDIYDANKGRFDRMSAKSKEEKKRNIDLLYTLFTGDPNPPKDVKKFRDIPLHSFVDSIDCNGVDSILNKTYIATTKDKLFVDYVEQIKKMIYHSNMIRNSLLEIIDNIFISNDDIVEEDMEKDIEKDIEKDEEKKMKYIINPTLSYEQLNDLITEARKIILNLYVNCEKNFIYALKILQAIIEAQIFETSIRQIKELERSIDAEYET